MHATGSSERLGITEEAAVSRLSASGKVVGGSSAAGPGVPVRMRGVGCTSVSNALGTGLLNLCVQDRCEKGDSSSRCVCAAIETALLIQLPSRSAFVLGMRLTHSGWKDARNMTVFLVIRACECMGMVKDVLPNDQAIGAWH